jgi:hypothetical protein
VVITLQRRRKKHTVASAVRRVTATTTSGPDESAISPVATNASISPFHSAGSTAHGAAA